MEKRKRSSPGSDNQRRLYKTQGMLFGDLDPVAYDRSIDPPVKACFNCWSFEHYRKICTEPPIYHCCNCGRKGINVDACPRCARAFQAQRKNWKNWVYKTFYYIELNQTEERKKMTHARENEEGHEEQWDDCDNKDDYQSSYSRDDKYGENAENKKKFNKIKEEDFGWEPIKSDLSCAAELNNLFTYMRHKKITEEFENDKINNVPVNLDETRMADRDSFGENSIVTVEDLSKKDVSCLTGDPLKDMLVFLEAVKHLPVTTQNEMVKQIINERQKLMVEKECNPMPAN